MPGVKFSTRMSAFASSVMTMSRAAGALQIERQALFVAIDAQEIGALAAEERRPPCPRVIPAPRSLES